MVDPIHPERAPARPLEEVLEGVRINSRISLLKMAEIIDIYNRPASKMNIAVLFAEDKNFDKTITIARVISNICESGDRLLWREEYSALMTFKYNSI